MVSSLVTGAAGFIGSQVVKALIERGDDVHVLVRDSSDLRRLDAVKDSLSFHTGDVGDIESVTRALKSADPEHVFHFAASNIASGAHAGAEDMVRVNVLGMSNVLSSLPAGIRSCVTMGSFLEYGPKDHALAESDRCEPPELYSVTKLAGTLLSQVEARSQKKPVVALRLFTPYGPEVQKGRLVYEVVRKALQGEPLTLTRPAVSRDFIYIDDVVALCLEASERAFEYAGGIFNLASGTKTTLQELSDIVLSITNSSSRVEWGSFKTVTYDADTWQADMTKTFASFRWRPQVSLEDGIRRTADWMRSAQRSV